MKEIIDLRLSNLFFQVSFDFIEFKLSWLAIYNFSNIGVRAGGRGGLQPPQSLGNSDVLGSKRKFGQSQVLKTFPCFFIIIVLKK